MDDDGDVDEHNDEDDDCDENIVRLIDNMITVPSLTASLYLQINQTVED